MIDTVQFINNLLLTEVTDVHEEQPTEKEITPEYSDDDLEKLVTFVKNMTTLYNLREDDWSDCNYKVIKKFFLNPRHPVLSVFFEGNDLACVLGLPETRFQDMTYFLREPNEVFDVDTFHDRINFGTVNESVEGWMLKILEGIFAPVFFSENTWPDSIL